MTPKLRASKPSDMAYVRATWSKCAYDALKAACYWSRQAHAPLYTLFQPLFDAVMTKLLARGAVLVAVNPDDDDQIFGFVAYEPGEPPVVHCVAVKRDFQRRGIARALLDRAGVSFERPALYSLGVLPRIVRGDNRSTAVLIAPKAWTHVPYGLLP